MGSHRNMSPVLFNILVIFSALKLEGTSGKVNMTEFLERLFDGYHAIVRPSCVDSKGTNVSIGLAIRQIIDLNEPRQILEVNSWIRLSWQDCNLSWNKSEYGDMDHVVVPSGYVWVPDITLYDNAANDLQGLKDYRPAIYSDGTISYNFPSIINSLCKVDVRFFPFDTQTCKLKFGSWIHHGYELDVLNRSESGDISNYISNGEWDIESVPLIRHEEWYNCCPEPYPDITFYVILKRKPMFYLMNLLFPCMLITGVAILGFLLPPDSGEKVSLEITVLLSLAVFLLVVSETMPPTSETFPYIGIYFSCAMMLVSLSCLMTVIVLNLHFKGSHGKEVPSVVRTIFLRYLAKLVFVKTKNSAVHPLRIKIKENSFQENNMAFKLQNGSLSHETNLQVHGHRIQETNTTEERVIDLDTLIGSSELISTLRKQLESLNRIEKFMFDKKLHRESVDEWHRLAQVLDRLFLVIFLLISIVSTLAILIPSANN